MAFDLYNNSITRGWHIIFVEMADERTNDLPLIRNPLPGLAILSCYLYFVLRLGPRIMANRKPFKMTNLLIVYNFVQVLFSVYLTWEAVTHAYFLGNYSFKCEPVDRSRSPLAMRATRGFYMYFVAKLTELLDTIFFVLRKKDRQITFLHLYHHTGMPMISWGCVKYFPGGHAAFIGMVNSFVHIVMYTYYLLAALGPEWQKYLWWKKYITSLQMFQFGICFLHSAQLLWTDCGFPRWSLFFTLPNAVFFYFLFNDFYQKAYKARQDKKYQAAMLLKEQEAKVNNNNGYVKGAYDKINDGTQLNGEVIENNKLKAQ